MRTGKWHIFLRKHLIYFKVIKFCNATKAQYILTKSRSISSEINTLTKFLNAKAFISELGILWKYWNCRGGMRWGFG